MMTKSRKFFAIGLLAALLVCSTGRAIPVSALAELAPDVAPVFDTQIYQIQDYIDNGMTDPQYEIFKIMLGMLTLAQSGSQEYKLTDPFQYEDGVWAWLKSMGVRTYNSLISLLPDTARMPITGDIFSTVSFKKASSAYVATVMGIAQEAKKYTSEQEFKDRVAEGSYYLPWNFDIQKGMNSIFGIYGGLYEWQFDSQPFTTTETYKSTNMSGTLTAEYNSYKNTMDTPIVRFNESSDSVFNFIWAGPYFQTYTNLFINTEDHTYGLYNAAGQYISNGNDFAGHQRLYYYQGSPLTWSDNSVIDSAFVGLRSYNPSSYSTYLQLVKDIYNNVLHFTYNENRYLFFEDFVQHVYVGTNWLDKHEIFNLTDLNFDEPSVPNDIDHYVSVPEAPHDYLLDIHNLVRDILTNTDLFQIFINHIYTPDGVLVHDTDLIRVTTSIYDLLRETNPELPVNLNDIAEYTDNSYLDRVKEEAKRGGNALAYLVAFWHNCDAELIYVLFGAGITVLVGAFIGKWGHS